jgi:hypothetical protein
MKLTDNEVEKLYGFGAIMGMGPTPKNAETDVVIPYPNPYSLNAKYSESRNQQGGRRRTRRGRKGRKGTRRSRRY